MRTLAVYFSKFGNTRKLAETIAETLRQAGDARVIDIDQLGPSDFEGVDLVVMGSPTHAFSLPHAVHAVLKTLPLGILAGKSVAAFDTTVKLWPLRHLRASPKLLRQLAHLGGNPATKPETFFVQTKNSQKTGQIDLLLEGELERARKWAVGLIEQANTQQERAM
ncbi:MAG: flavodoxin domain-containing protein [Phycisphaerales bacterium]